MKFIMVTLLAVGIAACSSPAPASKPAGFTPAGAASGASSAAASATSDVKKYDLKGRVVAINKAAKAVQVDAGDIPGFMMAMTMAYPVKDEHLLDNLAPGDQITAKVVSAKDGYWLEDIARAK